jgi:hypothetical protein
MYQISLETEFLFLRHVVGVAKKPRIVEERPTDFSEISSYQTVPYASDITYFNRKENKVENIRIVQAVDPRLAL